MLKQTREKTVGLDTHIPRTFAVASSAHYSFYPSVRSLERRVMKRLANAFIYDETIYAPPTRRHTTVTDDVAWAIA